MHQLDPSQARQALSTEQRNAQRESSPPTRTPAPVRPSALTRLWLAGIAAFGHKWSSTYGELPVDDDGNLTICGQLWATTLAGIDDGTLLAAIAHYANRGDQWPPVVGELRLHCLGVPTFSRFVFELGTPSVAQSPVTQAVWAVLDRAVYRQLSGAVAERRLRDAYDVVLEMIARGEDLPAPLPALPSPLEAARAEGIPETREERLERLEQIRKRLRLSPEEAADMGEAGMMRADA